MKHFFIILSITLFTSCSKKSENIFLGEYKVEKVIECKENSSIKVHSYQKICEVQVSKKGSYFKNNTDYQITALFPLSQDHKDLTEGSTCMLKNTRPLPTCFSPVSLN